MQNSDLFPAKNANQSWADAFNKAEPSRIAPFCDQVSSIVCKHRTAPYIDFKMTTFTNQQVSLAEGPALHWGSILGIVGLEKKLLGRTVKAKKQFFPV